jgi:hypothetical protein
VVPENADKAAIIIEPRQHYGKYSKLEYTAASTQL